MFCSSSALRVKAALCRHSSSITTSSPLWITVTRPCLATISILAGQRANVSSTTPKKARKRGAPTIAEKSPLTTKPKRTAVKASTKVKVAPRAKSSAVALAAVSTSETPRKRGRPRKTPIASESTAKSNDKKVAASSPRKRSPRKRSSKAPPRIAYLSSATREHWDRESLAKWAERKGISKDGTWYRGIDFEYLTMEVLSRSGFELHHCGRGDDHGTDLVGQWIGPFGEFKSLISCKASKSTSRYIRELEGARPGAPAGYQGANVLSILACKGHATKQVIEHMQRSSMPMAYFQIDHVTGMTRQFYLNQAATKAGLEGLSANTTYGAVTANPLSDTSKDTTLGLGESVTLYWLGRPLVDLSANC